MSDKEPDSASRRAARRHAVEWTAKLKCSEWAKAISVVVANASRTGVFVQTEEPPEAGSHVDVALVLPNQSKLALRGTVVHRVTPDQARAGRPAGVGIQFDEDHSTELLLLESMARAEMHAPLGNRTKDPGSTPAAVEPRRPKPRPSPQPRTSSVLGIDLGYSCSNAAVHDVDRVDVLSAACGSDCLSSVVSYPKTGEPVMGQRAKEGLVSDPESTVAAIKRLLGHGISSPQVAGHLFRAPYESRPGDDGAIVLRLGSREVTTADICSDLLRWIRARAEQSWGASFDRAVLTRPSSFSAEATAALRGAAGAAGLEVVELLSEPVAAVLALNEQVRDGEIVGVYDFGGGKFDFSVVRKASPLPTVLASAGDSWLGGSDFDLVIARDVADTLLHQTEFDLQQHPSQWVRVLMACESAKQTLSQRDAAEVTVPSTANAEGGETFRYQLTRDRFDELAFELAAYPLMLCRTALSEAGIKPQSLDHLLMIGGTAQIPLVRRLAVEYFEREPLDVERPTESIVRGAARRAKDFSDPRSAVGSDVLGKG